MTDPLLKIFPSECEVQVETSLNKLSFDNPKDIRIEASDELRKNLPKVYDENLEFFKKSCNSVIDMFVEEEDPKVRKNIFCALGDSMGPRVEEKYPELWEKSLQLFESTEEQGPFRDKANHYLLCMIFGQDPVEVENSKARSKKHKKTMKRIVRLDSNDPSDKKLLTKKLHKYIYPELLDENEIIFELGFRAVYKRLGYEYGELTNVIKSSTSEEADLSSRISEIEDGIVALLEVLDSCMTLRLKEFKRALYNEGINALKGISSYSMTLTLGQIPGKEKDVPESFKKITQKAIEIVIKKALPREYQQE
jgi:hypothetical protein